MILCWNNCAIFGVKSEMTSLDVVRVFWNFDEFSPVFLLSMNHHLWTPAVMGVITGEIMGRGYVHWVLSTHKCIQKLPNFFGSVHEERKYGKIKVSSAPFAHLRYYALHTYFTQLVKNHTVTQSHLDIWPRESLIHFS